MLRWWRLEKDLIEGPCQNFSSSPTALLLSPFILSFFSNGRDGRVLATDAVATTAAVVVAFAIAIIFCNIFIDDKGKEICWVKKRYNANIEEYAHLPCDATPVTGSTGMAHGTAPAVTEGECC